MRAANSGERKKPEPIRNRKELACPDRTSAASAMDLKEIFKDVDLPEITGIDFSKMSHAEIAQLLPSYGGVHPLKGILIDKATGKAYGIASGWDVETLTHNGIPLKSGAISPEAAAQAGGSWTALGNHVEPVAAAFMRKMGSTEGVVYINGRNPCWGTAKAPGCYYKLPEFLAEGSQMSVYNKYGSDFISAWPARKFHFTGLPD